MEMLGAGSDERRSSHLGDHYQRSPTCSDVYTYPLSVEVVLVLLRAVLGLRERTRTVKGS